MVIQNYAFVNPILSIVNRGNYLRNNIKQKKINKNNSNKDKELKNNQFDKVLKVLLKTPPKPKKENKD